MGFFSFFSKDRKERSVRLSDAEYEQLVSTFVEETDLPFLKLRTMRRPLRIFESKFGGIPYLPPGFAYPYNLRRENKPLKLLAQLNFDELPKLTGFPETGILQFYIACEKEEDCFGMDFDDLTSQKGFRVVYHREIIEDESVLQSPPELDKDGLDNFPFKGEFALVAETGTAAMSLSDFRFDDAYARYIRNNKSVRELFSIVNESGLDDYLDAHHGSSGHRVGGYPFFTQTDPREQDTSLREHTLMLLQIDSDGRGEDEIIWGDCGVANFFIRPEDFAKLDFSNVIYTWDCC